MVDRTFSYLCLMLPYYEKRLSQKIWNCHCFQILNINIFFDDHRQHHYRRHHHHYRCHHHHHHQGIAWQQTLLPRMPEAIFAVDWHHSAGFRSIFHQICKYVTKLICIETLSLVHYWLLSCLVKHTSFIPFLIDQPMRQLDLIHYKELNLSLENSISVPWRRCPMSNRVDLVTGYISIAFPVQTCVFSDAFPYKQSHHRSFFGLHWRKTWQWSRLQSRLCNWLTSGLLFFRAAL